jgi:hypothetical protein
MPNRAVQFLLIALVVLRGQCVALAHDIGASNATFYVRPTGIDVELYMGLNAGALLIPDPTGQLVVITPNTFNDFSDRLQSAGADLFALSATDDTPIKPESVAVNITDQSDVEYTLHFPLPPLPTTLKIHAAYIEKMVETHVGTLYVMNAIGDKLAVGEVRPDSPDIEAHLPALTPIASAPAPPSPTPSAPAIASRPATPWYLWTFLAAGAVAIALVAWRGMTNPAGRSTR